MCLSEFKPLDTENVKASLGFTISLVLPGEESLLESQKTWANAYLKLDDNDPPFSVSKNLVKAPFNLNLLMMSSQ